MIKKYVLFLVLLPFFLSTNNLVYGACSDGKCDTPNEYSDYRKELESQYNQTVTKKNTLANQLKLLDSQYQLTLLKINQTEYSINSLEKEIANLTIEIDKLEVQIIKLSEIYINQTVQNYKLQKRIPPFAFMFSSSLNDFLKQHHYVSSLQTNSQNNLINMETIRANYDNQKIAKQKKQDELESLKKSLASQKISLQNQKETKNELLQITKNDELNFQRLLSLVRNKLASFNNSSAGCLSYSPSGGSDGNFYSQIDKKWCTNYIGLQTTYTIGNAGCYLTSMSMMLKKIGNNITPEEYASDIKRFTSSADLAAPQVPSGYTYSKHIGYDSNIIDNEIRNNRYIIAQVPMRGSPSGYHFVTIISGSNGQYKMHDPIYGADLNFGDYYSTSRIVSLRLITK